MPLLTLDRIVQTRAVLVDEDGNEWEVPLPSLPEGSSEGDLLDVRVKKRKGASKDLQREIAGLQDKLKKIKSKG